MRRLPLAPLAAILAALLLASCTSSRAPSNAGLSGPGSFARPHKDGEPWWDVDVSRIPDAVPMPYNGPLKNTPYSVFGKPYYPIADARNYRATGTASWYGTKFHGQATANGETYDLYGMSAAHKTLPLPCFVKVTNLDNGKAVILRVNDRGPFYSDRLIDLSFAAAKKLGYAEVGTARVKVEGIDPHQWWAQQGKPVPLVLANNDSAPASNKLLALPAPTETRKVSQPIQPIEQYTPPPEQHAVAVAPVGSAVKKNVPASADGLYLQVGAFANPDAAELLKDKLSSVVGSAPVFISSVARNQQMLHRVRLGPISTPDEAQQLQETVRLASLGQPTLVRPD